MFLGREGPDCGCCLLGFKWGWKALFLGFDVEWVGGAGVVVVVLGLGGRDGCGEEVRRRLGVEEGLRGLERCEGYRDGVGVDGSAEGVGDNAGRRFRGGCRESVSSSVRGGTRRSLIFE